MFQRDENWIDKVLGKLNNKKSSNNNVKWLKIPSKEGSKVSIRMLPLNKDTFYIYMQHWGITDKPITCLRTFDKECPICKAIYNADDIDFKKKGKYLPKSRILFYVLKVNGNEPERKPYIFSTSPAFMEEYKALAEEGIILDDLVEGKKIILIRKTDNGQLARTVGQTIPIMDFLSEVEDKIVPLHKFIKEPSEEEIQEALNKLQEKFEYIRSKSGNDKDSDKQQTEDKSTQTGIVDFFGHKLTLQQKANLIQNVIGISVDDDYIECFGRDYNETDSKCEFCEHAFICKDFKEMFETSEEDVVNAWIKQAKIGG